MVRLPTLLYFYRKRLRVHAMQELLAGLGIATGVALVFAVQVANSSIVASAQQILHGITGTASLQLASRDAGGFDAAKLREVRELPGVAHAAPLMEQRATLIYGQRRVAVDLVGADESLRSLDGATTRTLLFGGFPLDGGTLLPAAVGNALGLPVAEEGTETTRVTIAVRGRSARLRVLGVVGPTIVGPVASAMIAAVPLSEAQELTGLTDRLTRILVVPRPGQEAAVQTGLVRIADGRLRVATVDHETRLLEHATGPIQQATGLFAAISAFVGLLFTFNAMLLTVPERRRFVADLRIMGYRPLHLVQILAFQAVALGALASAIGVLAGYVLSRTAAHSPPGYLAFAFPLGVEPVIAARAIALAFVGGILATCVAASQPLFDLRGRRAVNAVFKEKGEPGHAVSQQTRRQMGLGALGLLVAASVLVLVAPALTALGVAALAAATVLAIPATFAIVLRISDVPARRWRLNALVVANRALRATSIRSLALAATGAVAVFGSVAIEGAHRNLLQGLDSNFADYLRPADLWVTAGGDENSLTTQSFQLGTTLERARAVPGVARAHAYYGGLLDIGDRRVWIIGRPVTDGTLIPPSQLQSGDLTVANRLLRQGGWVALSQTLADREGVGVGDLLTIPTPTGSRSFRVAATLTNLGWGPGALIMRASDYRRAWGTRDPTALELTLDPRVAPSIARTAVQRALDPSGVALRVQTTAERDAQFRELARQGLRRLSQISTLLLITAVLAMAAAMGAGTWQRRAAFAQFRIMGWRSNQLWRTLLIETGLVLGTGCLTGALTGMYGHVLASRWMEISTGYPAPFALTVWQTIVTCVLVGCAAIAVSAVPGYFVSRAPTRLGLKANA
ncbi:MAG: FtsX-like permease family protein [Conexibacter sp.]